MSAMAATALLLAALLAAHAEAWRRHGHHVAAHQAEIASGETTDVPAEVRDAIELLTAAITATGLTMQQAIAHLSPASDQRPHDPHPDRCWADTAHGHPCDQPGRDPLGLCPTHHAVYASEGSR